MARRTYDDALKDAVRAAMEAGVPIEEMAETYGDPEAGPIPLGTLRAWASGWGIEVTSLKAQQQPPRTRPRRPQPPPTPLDIDAEAAIRESLDRRLQLLATGEVGTTKSRNAALELRILAESFGEVLRARQEGGDPRRELATRQARRAHIAKVFGVDVDQDASPALSVMEGGKE